MTELVFNKKQRHEIYQLAYDFYLSCIEIDDFHGICHCIDNAIINLYMHPVVNVYRDIDEFPELHKFQPDYIQPSDLEYWWDLRETEARISVFKQILEETENE
jgi:hypothetical protein